MPYYVNGKYAWGYGVPGWRASGSARQPALSQDIIDYIINFADTIPEAGCDRISKTLAGVGIRVSGKTIQKYLHAHYRGYCFERHHIHRYKKGGKMSKKREKSVKNHLLQTGEIPQVWSGKEIKIARFQQDISLTDLAKLLGCSRTWLSLVENGHKNAEGIRARAQVILQGMKQGA